MDTRDVSCSNRSLCHPGKTFQEESSHHRARAMPERPRTHAWSCLWQLGLARCTPPSGVWLSEETRLLLVTRPQDSIGSFLSVTVASVGCERVPVNSANLPGADGPRRSPQRLCVSQISFNGCRGTKNVLKSVRSARKKISIFLGHPEFIFHGPPEPLGVSEIRYLQRQESGRVCLPGLGSGPQGLEAILVLVGAAF